MLTVAEARVLVTTSVDDADLADLIAREEAYLAARVGPLEGERSETFVTLDGDEVLRLQRQTDAVTVDDDNGSVSDCQLRPWADVVRTAGAWSGEVVVSYTPNDSDIVKRSLITLLRLTLNESAFASEAAGDYNVTSDPEAQRMARWRAWRTLLRPAQPTTVRLQSAIATGGRHIVAVAREATGS